MATMLEARDLVDQGRILLHAIFMASETLQQDDANAICTLAHLASEKLGEAKTILADLSEAKAST